MPHLIFLLYASRRHHKAFTTILVFSLTSFEVTEAFSGDMNNLLLSGTTAGVFVPRNFNDPLLMIGKQGVSFGGVIRGAVRTNTIHIKDG